MRNAFIKDLEECAVLIAVIDENFKNKGACKDCKIIKTIDNVFKTGEAVYGVEVEQLFFINQRKKLWLG